jgi:hypothetical protein
MLLRQNDRPLRVAKVDSVFRRDVLEGRSVRPRAIPARWLYDRSDQYAPPAAAAELIIGMIIQAVTSLAADPNRKTSSARQRG